MDKKRTTQENYVDLQQGVNSLPTAVNYPPTVTWKSQIDFWVVFSLPMPTLYLSPHPPETHWVPVPGYVRSTLEEAYMM